MKASFALRQHADAALSLRCTRNEASTFDRQTVYLSIPTTRVSENVLDGILHRCPSQSGMAFPNVGLATLEEVLDKVRENMTEDFPDGSGGISFVVAVKRPRQR